MWPLPVIDIWSYIRQLDLLRGDFGVSLLYPQPRIGDDSVFSHVQAIGKSISEGKFDVSIHLYEYWQRTAPISTLLAPFAAAEKLPPIGGKNNDGYIFDSVFQDLTALFVVFINFLVLVTIAMSFDVDRYSLPKVARLLVFAS